MEIKEELLDLEDIKRSKKPLLELFIRRTAVITQTSEHISDLIIKDQFRNAARVVAKGSKISEVEFPNMGTLYISNRKANKRIDRHRKHIDKLLLLDHSEKTQLEVANNEETIDLIKNKIKNEL